MKKSKASTPRVMDRPVTLKSGVALQSNYSVQHRSDILMEEQIEAVKNAQDALKQALADLESAKIDDEIDSCRAIVEESKQKSEKAIMVLLVLDKVNTELTFARAELDEALDKQKGDINEARKRVMWLEDRMGLLCGKARLRGQPVQKQKSKSAFSSERYRSRLGSYNSDNSSSDDGAVEAGRGRMGRNMSIEFKSDTTRRGREMFSPSESGSDYQPYPQQTRPGMTDTPSSGAESFIMAQKMAMQRGPRMDDSDSESESGMPPPPIPAVKPPGRMSASSNSSSVRTEDDTTTITSKPVSQDFVQMPVAEEDASVSQDTYGVPYDAETEASRTEDGEREDEDQTTTVDEEAREKEDLREEEEEEEEAREEEADEQEEEERPESEASQHSEKSESARDERDGEEEDKRQETFMTEVSQAKSVTIVSPKREDTRQAYLRDDMIEYEIRQRPQEEDLARAYWMSEHHRFEYSEFSEMLVELDPLSYHAVGLAVPGSFLKKSNEDFHELPWRSKRKGSDIQDVHKIALDKLAGRMYSMSDKMYEASMLSVRGVPNADQLKRGSTMFGATLEKEATRAGTPPAMITAPPTTADAFSRPVTVSSDVVPSKVKPVHNVYYPKPIPPPEVLPLTRTSKDKEYPRMTDEFGDSNNVKRRPAVRVVDQRNLHKETKLKLFKERPKQREEGPSATEQKFRMMLEREKSMGSRSSRSSRQSSGRNNTKMSSLSRTITKDDSPDQVSTWSRIKPSSRGREYSGLKWERVKTIVHANLVSKRPDERRDAAKHLGILRCGDAMVFYALKERLKTDEDQRVRYESAKALILLGCWDEDVLQMVLKYLVMGNNEIRQDLIRNMIDGKNVQYVNKKTPTFPELVKVLSHFCRNPDPDDANSFDAAVLLGRLCVADENAKFKLLRSLDQSFDTHIKAKALEVLVKQLTCTSWEVVQHSLELFQQSHVWKYRALAADLLIILGREHVCKKGEEERIYSILEKKLWDDPTTEVRVSAAKALTALGMFSKACERIEKRLEDTDEDVRAQAVISVGTLEMKNEKIIRLLLEMLELDASEYVRLMIARTFTILKMTDKRVMRALRERDKVEGPLARESRKALKVLESLAMQSRMLSSPVGRKSILSRSGTPRSHRLTPAVTV